jgi:ribosomal peptide maturation radical SAM protein 1
MAMRIVLVDMPWSSIDTPSLALGILKRRIHDTFPGAEVEVLHANLDYVDFAAEAGVTFEEFDFLVNSYFSGHNEWVFSAALNGHPLWKVAEFAEFLAGRVPEPMLARAREMHELAPLFVERTAAKIAAHEPDVVGFTSTFAQNAAALAAARAVSQRPPHPVIVFGGANCDGAQGAALHRNFRFVDFVVRGEGEAALPELLAAIGGGGDVSRISGLCWRSPGGESVANPMEAAPLPPETLVPPDFGDYFEQHARSVAGSWIEPRLIVESARGCWWGAKHHCKFCGLNGSFMEFRSKSPARFAAELLDLVRRHRILDVWVTDNIIDMGYLSSLAPRLAESGYDLRLSYEIKSNLNREQLTALYLAGVSYVQPGVESLSSRVLKLMDKGVTGCQNVRLLRDAETVGVNMNWNYLYGFPGETDDDYTEIIDQLPALHHLTPPTNPSRVKAERFSPYFNRPDLGFGVLRPAAHYRYIYDLPESELAELVYIFDAPPHGISRHCLDRLRQAVTAWTDAYLGSRLTHCDLGEHVVLVNTRPGFAWDVLDLIDPVEVTAFRLLDNPHTPQALLRKTAAVHPQVTADQIGTLLTRWRALGLTFHEDGRAVHVAPAAANQDLMRLDGSRRGRAGPVTPALGAR